MQAVGPKWTAVYEKWRDDTGKQTPKDYLGGTYFCSFPGPNDTTSIRADIDLEVKMYPIKWSITSPDSAYYPGRHEGKVEIPPDYPFKSPWIIWNTPIFSPFVSFNKEGLGHVSADWNAGQWSPTYTIRNILQSIANFLVYEPFCSRLPQIEGWTLPCLYHPVGMLGGLTSGGNSALVHSDEFLLVTNFFCRAYNQIDDYRMSNSNVEDVEKRQSICAILALQKVFEHLKSRVDMRNFLGHLENIEKIEDEDVEVVFQVCMTNEEWILKEQEWANICSRKYGLGFV
ncbi:hypothetical protein NM208_g8561 [Fusarium decemcellulare]|uniref:Uncharacterized protein n=1 Tax=Fusarium decemcellulare TaxID=57161 RepID=A0ACC1S4T3_9HYPO|nr:hypothetical protein NM208_g8561 [Fusarium decemcellulare]